MTTITINNKATFNAMGTHTKSNHKPVINLDTGAKYASATDAAEILGCAVDNVSACCCGRTRTCKGYHLAYVKHASENVDILADRISDMHKRQTELEQKAKSYEENQTQLAELSRLKADFAKANEEFAAYIAYKEQKAKVEELLRIKTELQAAYRKSIEDYNAAMQELQTMRENL